MFKLPLLRPHLTGANGVEALQQKSRKEAQQADRVEGYGSPGGWCIETKTWEDQASGVSQGHTSESFRSNAVQAEFRLRDALSKCHEGPLDDDKRPQRLRTAVCCQVLGELSKMCGPYNAMMDIIWKEMVQAVYSDYYLTGDGTLQFDQVPYYVVAERLAAEKEQMLDEKEAWKRELMDRQDDVYRIEEQLLGLQGALKDAEKINKGLKKEIDEVNGKERRAVMESQLAKVELLKVRQEVAVLKDSLESYKTEYKALKEQHTQSSAQHGEELSSLKEQLVESGRKLTEVSASLLGKVPKTKLEEALAKIDLLEADLATSQQEILKLQHVTNKIGSMTPRPSWQDYKSVQEYKIFGSTQEVMEKLAALVESRSQEVANFAEELEQAQAVLQPDARRMKCNFTIVADSSEFFLTESGSHGEAPNMYAAPLGLGCDAPQFLRTNTKVLLQKTTLEDVQRVVQGILQMAEDHAQTHSPGSTRDFILPYLMTIHGSLKNSVAAGYNLVHSCKEFSQDCAQIGLFLDVVEGQLADSVLLEIVKIVKTLAQVLSCLASTQSSQSDGVVALSTMEGCLQKLFPGHSRTQISQFLAPFANEHTDGCIPVEAISCPADMVPWTSQSPCLVSLFEAITKDSWEKFKDCANGICTALSQKSILGADGTSRLIDLADVEATLKAQNFNDPDGIFAHVRHFVANINHGGGSGRVPVELVLDFFRVHANIRLPKWFDWEGGMEYCSRQGVIEM